MILDASTVFVLVVTVCLVAVIGWAEVHSRRRHQHEDGPSRPATGSTQPVSQAKPGRRRAG